jgi:hypothetical protein
MEELRDRIEELSGGRASTEESDETGEPSEHGKTKAEKKT